MRDALVLGVELLSLADDEVPDVTELRLEAVAVLFEDPLLRRLCTRLFVGVEWPLL